MKTVNEGRVTENKAHRSTLKMFSDINDEERYANKKDALKIDGVGQSLRNKSETCRISKEEKKLIWSKLMINSQ